MTRCVTRLISLLRYPGEFATKYFMRMFWAHRFLRSDCSQPHFLTVECSEWNRPTFSVFVSLRILDPLSTVYYICMKIIEPVDGAPSKVNWNLEYKLVNLIQWSRSLIGEIRLWVEQRGETALASRNWHLTIGRACRRAGSYFQCVSVIVLWRSHIEKNKKTNVLEHQLVCYWGIFPWRRRERPHITVDMKVRGLIAVHFAFVYWLFSFLLFIIFSST